MEENRRKQNEVAKRKKSKQGTATKRAAYFLCIDFLKVWSTRGKMSMTYSIVKIRYTYKRMYKV